MSRLRQLPSFARRRVPNLGLLRRFLRVFSHLFLLFLNHLHLLPLILSPENADMPVVEWTEALPYVQLYLSTCASYQDQPQVQEVLQTVVTRLNTKNSVQVLAGAQAGNVDDMMDMILRCAARIFCALVRPHTEKNLHRLRRL